MLISNKDWETMTFIELQNKYNLNQISLYNTIIAEKKYNHKSIIEKIKMTDLEEKYIVDNPNLSVRQLANMFHKSYNAMLIYVKMHGYYERIRK